MPQNHTCWSQSDYFSIPRLWNKKNSQKITLTTGGRFQDLVQQHQMKPAKYYINPEILRNDYSV